MLRSAACALVSLLCLVPSALFAQTVCGRERWPVKIWIDDYAAKVDTVPTPITVAELTRIPRPKTTFPNQARVPDVELKTFVLRARYVQVLPQDNNDSDIHLIVRDLDVENATLVTEIPHPGCAVGYDRLAAIYAEVRDSLRTVGRNDVIEITGIGFFDRRHNQRGMARNGLEIHPVLKLRVVQRSGESPPASRLIGPRDTTAVADSVWINTSSGVYHCRGTQYFGRTVRGRFASEREALQSGARPAGGRRCGS